MDMRIWFRHCLLIALFAATGASAGGAPVTFKTTTVGISEPGEPVAYDFDGNGVYELLITGATGGMGVYDPRTLRPLWEKQISQKALTPAVIGDFLGTGVPIVAVGSIDRWIYFLRAGTGEQVARHEVGEPMVIAPSVVGMRPRDGSDRDGLIVCDDAGSVRLITLSGRETKEEFEVRNSSGDFTIGRITHPAAIGDITGDDIPEVVVGTVSGTVQAFSITNPQRRMLYHAPQGISIDSGILLADVMATGQANLCFGTSTGDLMVLKYQHDLSKPNLFFSLELTRKMLGRAHGHLIAGDLDGDGTLDIAGQTQNVIATFDGASVLTLFGTQPYAANAPPISPVSLVRLASGKTALIFGDSRGGLFFFDATQKTPPEVSDAPVVLQQLAPAGNLTGSGRVEAVLVDRSRDKLALARFDTATAADSLPTMMHAIDFSRDGRWTSGTASRIIAMREKAARAFDAAMSSAETAGKKGDWSGVAVAAADALAINPTDPKALAWRDKAEFRQHWFRNIATWVLSLAALAAAAFGAWRITQRSGRFRRAEKLLAQGQHRPAIQEFRAILARQPQSRRAILALAQACMSSGELDADAIEVLEKARALQPDNSELTLSLAQAYSEGSVETEAAQQVYLVALATMEGARGKIAFHAANMLRRRGDMEQALKYYRLALKEGFADIAVHEQLADLFIETKQFSESTVPVFEIVSLRHRNDARLLEGLCLSYSAVRRNDEKARQAYRQLLELRPTSVVALRQSAKIELQAGNAAQAAEYAERALKIVPDDVELIALLSHCYMALERKDDVSIDAHMRALKLSPGQPDLLRVTALALLDKGIPQDQETYQLLKRANAANPNDIELLLGLSETAAKMKDNEMVAECLEQALQLGHQSQQTYSRLAEAYIALGDTSGKTERVYREALRIDPDNPILQQSLAASMVSGGRTDADAMIVLERVFLYEASQQDIGKHLARTYLKNERFDDAIKLVRWLIQHNREDEELQRLFAQASLQSNRIEEAIRQYEHLIKQKPDDREATVNLAAAYAQKQLTDDASAARYAKALEYEPENTVVRIAYARHHGLAGRYAQAIEEMRKALASDRKADKRIAEEARTMIAAAQDRTDLRWFLANLLIDSGNLTGAMEQLEVIFEIDPSQLKTVLQALDRILAKDPANITANLQKGVLLKAQGRFEEARSYLERAYKANTANPDAARELEDVYDRLLRENDEVAIRFELGKLNYAQNDFDKAIGQFQKTAQDFRYENESIKMLGLCFVGKGMLEFALQEFRKLVIDEEMKGILYDLAQRYEAKNDLVGAKQVYRQLFAADIDYRNVKTKFEALAGSTSDPMTLERTAVMTQLSEKARLRYELIEELGRGAMGIVYKAKDNELEELVALKILPENLSQNPDALMRFRAEARSARRLAHPNVVRIHDIGEEMGRKYISMEYVQGSDLKRHLRQKKKFPPDEVLPIAVQVCRALDYAHSMGIVHRDIKPANIMITDDGIVKVSDFGIAKILETTSETVAGAIIGTPLYMSPEQIQGQPIDNRADIYSLGIMLYELLTGKPPFIEGDLAYQHLRVPPKPIEGVPDPLHGAMMQCLQKNREQRWPSAGEMLRALEKGAA